MEVGHVGAGILGVVGEAAEGEEPPVEFPELPPEGSSPAEEATADLE